MDFVFQGFQSGLPPWLYLLLTGGTIALAWWSYKDLKTIRPVYRYTLITFRSIVFFILLMLLLNPFFKSEGLRYEIPEVLVLFDNSASVSINKGEYEGTETYRQLISDLNFKGLDRLSFRYFEVDNDITPGHPDSLAFAGSETNLYNAIEVIRNNQSDARAAILFSDGIFNKGRTPVFLSRELEIPVFTVALGDTSRLKDLIVQNIVTNATGYLNSIHPVNVDILNQGFGQDPFQVQLKSGGNVVQSQVINPGSSTSSHTLTFELELKEEGLQQFEISIPPENEEWSAANNSQPFSVEVLDDKQSILSLAFEIHPDVKMVRTLLLQDENTQLSTRTWLGGDRFIRGDLRLDPDTLDLIVLHGYPPQGLPGQIEEQAGELLERVPSFLFPTPNGRLNDIPSAESVLPISSSGSASFLEVNFAPLIESTEHPVMELPEISYDRLPPVYAPIQGLTPSPGSTVLFNSAYRGTPVDQPLIAIRQTGNLRRAQFNAFGWYLIYQGTDSQAREFIRDLIYNTVSWTATKPDDRRLKIQPAQKIFTGNEPVSFNAFLTNESGEVEPGGVITITISGENMEPRMYNMDNTGGGQYQLDIGALPEGIYQFEAAAKKGSRTIDTQKGEFSVSGSNIEYVNTIRNDNLLRLIADATNGMFYTYQNARGLWQDMDERELLEQVENIETDFFYPYQHAFWFILAIALLGAEWFIRKYVALP